MVKINYNSPVSMPVHMLKAIVPIEGFSENEVKKCYIQKMSDGRFGVLSATWPTFDAPVADNFFKVFTESELHDSLEEIDIIA